MDILPLYWKHYRLARHEERFDAALIFINRILDLEPGNLDAHLKRAEMLGRLGDLDQAIECYRAVIKRCGYDSLHPHYRTAHQALSDLIAGMAIPAPARPLRSGG